VLSLVALVACATEPPSPSPPPDRGLPLPDFVLGIVAPADGAPAPDATLRAQFLSMVGREDLAPAQGRGLACEPVLTDGAAIDPVAEIARRAAAAQIVIVNEAHDAPQNRLFIGRVAAALRPLGYNVYAAETLFPPELAGTPQAWPRMGEGFYTMEPVFGSLLRQVRALGYSTVAYEDMSSDNSGDEFAQISRREQAQAENLVTAIFRDRPDARVLIHVGYSHARELPERTRDGREQLWMAARLKSMTGFEPVTVDQTRFSATGATQVLCTRPPDAGDPIDIYVGEPRVTFADRRPTWLARAGRRAVAIPARIRAQGEPTIVVAQRAGEPDDAVPADRVMAQPGEDIALMLEPGRYRVAGWTRARGWTGAVDVRVVRD
jgi:hypothetical protein